jgi:hypothetical protein
VEGRTETTTALEKVDSPTFHIVFSSLIYAMCFCFCLTARMDSSAQNKCPDFRLLVAKEGTKKTKPKEKGLVASLKLRYQVTKIVCYGFYW